MGFLLLPNAFAEDTRNILLELRDASSIERIQNRYRARVIEQIEDQPVFLIQVADSRPLLRRLSNDPLVLSIEEDRLVTLGTGAATDAPDGRFDLNQSPTSLFWSVMSLFSEKEITDFYGSEVIEGYASQNALDVIHATDVRSVTTGAGTRVAFIDTGADPDHPALRPWLETGVDLLGTDSTSEFSGLSWSVMSLFEDMVRVFRRAMALDWSVMSLFAERVSRGDLDWSVMSLFWEDFQKLDLDWSVMSLFWSVMSLFGDEIEAMDLDWSVMSLFSEDVEEFDLDWSVMSLFGHDADGHVAMPPKFGHGTLVAGLIHAVAPEADLVPIRAFDSYGNSSLFLATAAIYAAVDLEVDVINMSFSIGEDSPAFKEALDYAWSRGVTLVASVGNDGIDAGDIYPAAYPIVVAVAATDFDDRRASFSNFGRTVNVTAPGELVVSTYPGGLYARASGTSFSAPIVSGAVALLVSVGQQNNAAARNTVVTADSIDDLNPEFERALGFGRINVLNALRKR